MKLKRDNSNVKIRRTGKSMLMRFMSVMAAFAIFAATLATVEMFNPFSVIVNAADALTEGDYSYTVNEDGETVTIIKYTGTDAEVEIPGTLGGKTVTAIGEEVFYECKSITSVIMPNTITEIGETAFGYCTSLISVTIPDSVTIIDHGAFRNCVSLIYVTIPENVRIIGMSAFMYCESLISVTIPNSVISIGSTPFWGCKSLKEITVEENNAYYSVVDGALLNKAKTNLICYSVGRSDKTYIIPNGVTYLGNFSFYYGASLESVTLPNSLTKINVNVFRECTSLSSVTIPDSITTIGGHAFYHCGSLKDVYYAGTEAQWNQIDIDYSGNDALKGATIHYNSTGNEPDIPDLYTIDFDFSGVNMSIKWGCSLFEHSSSEYDNNLAIAACALSGLAENKESAQPTKDLLLKMGFSESSMKSDHFNEWNPEKPAYVFANRDITVNGKTKKLIAVTIRGSQTILGDWLFSDFRDGMYFGFSNSTVAVCKALQEYVDEHLGSVPKEDLIFFINGHSLGAAVAGSLTTILSNRLTPQDNIFAYTIAAPKYANWGKQEKYTNLFETINKYDAVPILGCPGSSHYGVLDEFDPNQVADFYKYWNSWENDTLKRVDFIKNHSTTAYMSYLMTKDFFINDAITPWNDKYYLISVCCPVNVEIYDTDDNLLGRVVDNVVDESVANENVLIKIEGDEKYIFVESDKEIYIKLVGTDSGTMEYSVQNLKAVDEAVTEDDIVIYKDVTLEKDKEFYSDITEKNGIADASLYVVDPETNQFIKTVELDGTEISLDAQNTYTITFDTNGGTSSNNELITYASGKLSSLPTAVRTNYVFDGWFTSVSGGAKITTDTVFTENTTVYAHWTNSGNNSGSTDSASSGSTGGLSFDSTSSNESSSDSPDSTSTNSSGDKPFDSTSDTSFDSNDSNSTDGMSSPSNGTSDSDQFSASGESSNNSNGSLCDDSGNLSNNPPTGVSAAIIPLLFAAGASMVIFHKRDKK